MAWAISRSSISIFVRIAAGPECVFMLVLYTLWRSPQLEESAARNDSVMRRRVRGSIRDAARQGWDWHGRSV
jgi:hypothetical protein